MSTWLPIAAALISCAVPQASGKKSGPYAMIWACFTYRSRSMGCGFARSYRGTTSPSIQSRMCQVLLTLTRSVCFLSLSFTPKAHASACRCILLTLLDTSSQNCHLLSSSKISNVFPKIFGYHCTPKTAQHSTQTYSTAQAVGHTCDS